MTCGGVIRGAELLVSVAVAALRYLKQLLSDRRERLDQRRLLVIANSSPAGRGIPAVIVPSHAFGVRSRSDAALRSSS